jgi:hypothetical protein
MGKTSFNHFTRAGNIGMIINWDNFNVTHSGKIITLIYSGAIPAGRK